mmetsp:Transcript_14121/g.29092  ORF Transcript_14121/g.29092 Transcript_14121/m.29092 type:complete len:323 (+) Transcript_14121:122-1090(+)
MHACMFKGTTILIYFGSSDACIALHCMFQGTTILSCRKSHNTTHRLDWIELDLISRQTMHIARQDHSVVRVPQQSNRIATPKLLVVRFLRCMRCDASAKARPVTAERDNHNLRIAVRTLNECMLQSIHPSTHTIHNTSSLRYSAVHNGMHASITNVKVTVVYHGTAATPRPVCCSSFPLMHKLSHAFRSLLTTAVTIHQHLLIVLHFLGCTTKIKATVFYGTTAAAETISLVFVSSDARRDPVPSNLALLQNSHSQPRGWLDLGETIRYKSEREPPMDDVIISNNNNILNTTTSIANYNRNANRQWLVTSAATAIVELGITY